MKLNLLAVLCLIGVPFALSIKNFQNWDLIAPLLIKQQATWQAAQNYCRANHIDLFTITSQSDQVKLTDEVNKNNVVDLVWVDLYIDLDNWYWTYNHLPLKNISIRPWSTGYPYTDYGEDVCGVIRYDGTWQNGYCLQAIAFICYDANRTYANRFVGYNLPLLTWSNALTYCRQYHTDLATSFDAADITQLVQILTNIAWTGAWFGLTRNTWTWGGGVMPTYLPWLTGQPDNYYTYENCAAAQDGLLYDEQCTVLNNFVCSAYLFRKQVVKLQVMSDQSVLDPAVQLYILDLINQKLQEHGMMVNTTVTWKVQPDGSIFYKEANDL